MPLPVHAYEGHIREPNAWALQYSPTERRRKGLRRAPDLKAGDRSAKFPEGSFPPGLPFVKTGLVPGLVPAS
jgi:hypothetical protein